MSDSSIIFEFHPKKITFKAPTTQTIYLHFNLLYNNKKLSNTEPLQIPQGNKQFDFSYLPCLFFDTKNETNQHPIMIYVIYSQKNPAKKIIMKRSEMMKKYEIEKKDHFNFQQDFGAFSIFYEVLLKNILFEAEEFVREIEILQSNDPKQLIKTEESSAKTFQRPTLLQVGAKAEKIRESSYDNKQSSESSIKDFPKPKDVMLKSNQKNPQTLAKLGSNLTFSKEQDKCGDLVKKDIKVNLFETFNPKYQQQQPKSEIKLENKHQTQKQAYQNHQPKKLTSHKDNHKPTHSSHHESHKQNEHCQSQHHSSHDSHEHGHEEPHPLSLKLKTVIVMLIVGFLLLMYDALDDRFSRKITKKEVITHKDNHSDSHHEGEKKKKTGKKQKKTITH